MLTAFGLHDWTFRFNRRRRALGLCCFHRSTIEMSAHLVLLNGSTELRDTLLHEIVHALVGPGHGHDAVWKQKCVEVGARPRRCGQARMPPGR